MKYLKRIREFLIGPLIGFVLMGGAVLFAYLQWNAGRNAEVNQYIAEFDEDISSNQFSNWSRIQILDLDNHLSEGLRLRRLGVIRKSHWQSHRDSICDVVRSTICDGDIIIHYPVELFSGYDGILSACFPNDQAEYRCATSP